MPKDYQERFNRQYLKIDEKDAIDVLLNWNEENELYDLRFFNSFVAPDLQLQEYLEIKGFYFATNILRSQLGFDKNKKPGDFDIIVIPYTNEEILFNRSGVFEVKVVRPTRKRPQKNANSLGLTQLNGLINDGFPFVGLIHISTTEPLNDEEKKTIEFFTIPTETRFPEGTTAEDHVVNVKYDFFQSYSSDKQMQRLISEPIPKFVCLYCFGLSLNLDGKYVLETGTVTYSDFQKGYFNPNRKIETVDAIRNHFNSNKNLYLERRMRK